MPIDLEKRVRFLDDYPAVHELRASAQSLLKHLDNEQHWDHLQRFALKDLREVQKDLGPRLDALKRAVEDGRLERFRSDTQHPWRYVLRTFEPVTPNPYYLFHARDMLRCALEYFVRDIEETAKNELGLVRACKFWIRVNEIVGCDGRLPADALSSILPEHERTPDNTRNAARRLPDVYTPRQERILRALDGRALKKEPLAEEVCGGQGRMLYKPGGIKELQEQGLVARVNGVGYYRPNAPPPNALTGTSQAVPK